MAELDTGKFSPIRPVKSWAGVSGTGERRSTRAIVPWPWTMLTNARPWQKQCKTTELLGPWRGSKLVRSDKYSSFRLIDHIKSIHTCDVVQMQYSTDHKLKKYRFVSKFPTPLWISLWTWISVYLSDCSMTLAADWQFLNAWLCTSLGLIHLVVYAKPSFRLETWEGRSLSLKRRNRCQNSSRISHMMLMYGERLQTHMQTWETLKRLPRWSKSCPAELDVQTC